MIRIFFDPAILKHSGLLDSLPAIAASPELMMVIFRGLIVGIELSPSPSVGIDGVWISSRFHRISMKFNGLMDFIGIAI